MAQKTGNLYGMLGNARICAAFARTIGGPNTRKLIPDRFIQPKPDLLINNSSLLLRTVAVVGIGFALLAFILTAYVVARYLLTGSGVIGWTSLVTINLLIGGLILFEGGIGR